MVSDAGADRPQDWIARLERLYTPVVADVLDRLGWRQQAMRADVRPLFDEAKAAGFALTVQVVPARELRPAEPYRGELEAVDALRAGDILVVSPSDFSFWGELLSTAARARGARGVVIDGYTRDTRRIVDMGFPVFARGIHPADSLGRIEVAAHGVPIVCAEVAVETGDLVLADRDGVVVVPRRLAPAAIEAAEEKARGENLVRKALEGGMSATEAFKKYGVL